MTSAFRLTIVPLLLCLSIAATELRAKDAPTAAASPSAAPTTQPPEKTRVLVTISKQTTYITEPLRPDGYPDYVAALNQRCSEGATPENNAAVLFWKAMGPAGIPKEVREQYFQMLGMPPLPEEGAYFVKLDAYAELHKSEEQSQLFGSDGRPQIWSDLEAAEKRPWSEDTFPVLEGWLAANAKPLALLIEASKRPRCYEPLICRNIDFGMVVDPTSDLLNGPIWLAGNRAVS